MTREARFLPQWSGRTPVYTCRVCGKRTRETGDCESSVEMCRKCYFIAGQENSHTDNHTGRMADCADCRAVLASEGYSIGPEDRWCDSRPAGEGR